MNEWMINEWMNECKAPTPKYSKHFGIAYYLKTKENSTMDMSTAKSNLEKNTDPHIIVW